ncbi:Protein strawberry notch 1 [Thelohanellus kitauei]|uniref:Protein strawberry notch 1 n=1 Tax=Thelohanellus kitauei TaxID=669202 RepID=A0A0C2J3E4_THEKT|nr:Protein strawberry notch 1 [Thelohanellus kitauei]
MSVAEPDDDFDWFFSSEKPPEPVVEHSKALEDKASAASINSYTSQAGESKYKANSKCLNENFLELIGVASRGFLTFDEELAQAKAERLAQKNRPGQPKDPSYDVLKPAPIIDEYEEADFGDTYDDYKPAKLDFGVKHPDSVVESSSLSVVSPPDVTYKLKIPSEVIEQGLISSLQLESVVYACQKHEDVLASRCRAGYLIGDGPGVGKGRIISGIIFENMMCGRSKALWVSVSSDLKYDAQNDLEDVGCDVHIVSLHKLTYNDRVEEFFEEYNDVGVLFSTYASLIGESHSPDSYFRSRYDQIMDWLTPQFDGVIVFDECHKAKNLKPNGASKPTKTALCVLKLQNDLPRARIVYCSATGASEPRNMAYMTRLGLWGPGTPFPEFESFLTSVERRGIGAMELVAIDMKQRGVYLARQLSFSGVTFKVQEIPLSENFKDVYNYCVLFWNKACNYFEKAADLLGYCSRDKTFLMAHFYSAHQRFFKGLCIASKVGKVVEIVKEALSNNKAVVIGLQSTGESISSQLIKQRRFPRIVSTSYGILLNLVNRQFPTPDRKAPLNKTKSQGNGDSLNSSDTEIHSQLQGQKRKHEASLNTGGTDERDASLTAGVQVNRYDWNSFVNQSDLRDSTQSNKSGPKQLCQEMIDELLSDIERLHHLLPPNTLDLLIDMLGGPERVAEMTGRKGRIVKSRDGDYVYESRSNEETSLELVNVHERDNFMQGNKYIAIISEAASSGISLQSDRRVANTRQRLHITLELSWSADRAIQQFGRTHRSNQQSPPEYLFLISELAGEKRFACVVAKRLESLGALTHGDRRASETRDLSQFNIDTKYGRYALDRMIDMLNDRTPLCCELPVYSGNFLADAKSVSAKLFSGDYSRNYSESKPDTNVKIHKFLNRLLGVKVDLQNAIYEFYTSILDHYIKDAQLSGKYDFGIIDYGLGSEVVYEKSKTKYEIKSSSGGTSVELIAFSVERGINLSRQIHLLKILLIQMLGSTCLRMLVVVGGKLC